MKWRPIILAASADFARRAKGRVFNFGPHDPESVGFNKGAAYAYQICADELRYLAEMPAHEAGQKIRELVAKMEVAS